MTLEKRSYFFSLVLLLCTFSFGFAQSEVSGKIIDIDGSPIPYANVLIHLSSDSSFIKGDISDDSGLYSISIEPDIDYFIVSTYIGFEDTYSDSFSVNKNDNYNMSNILLYEGVALDEVNIVAKKPLFEQKIDRMVVNVASSVTSAGGTALDVLEKSPGVIVNRQNNAISLAGKEGVVIMINGKVTYQPAESILQSLEGMNSDNIESIELITTPPANFDAEGNAGFINIVLKQRVDLGLNGTFSISGGYGEGEVGSSAVSLNYRKNKLNIYSNYSFLLKAQKQVFDNFRKVTFNNQFIESDVVTDRDPRQVNHNLRFGLDYQLTDNTVIGVLANAYDNKWTMDAFNNGQTKIDNKLDSKLDLTTTELNQWKHFLANINIEHKFTETQKITINADHLIYEDNNPNDYLTRFYNGDSEFLSEEKTRSSKFTPIDINVGQIDYTNKLSEKLNYVGGIKMAISEFENDVSVESENNGVWEFVDQFTNESTLKEKITAVYSSVDWKPSEKNMFKLGLRYEYTDSKLNTLKEGSVVDRQFGKVFPSVFYSRTIDDDQSFNLSYTKRISRPTFNEMAPFAIFLDPNTYFFGNAGLQPAIADNYKVDYRYKSYLLSVQYAVEDSTIARFQDRVILESNQQAFEPINLSNTRSISGSLSVPIYIGNFWQMQNNFMVQWAENTSYYNDDLVQFEQTSYNINSSQNFTINNTLSMEVSGFYRSAAFFGRSTIDAMYGLNFGLQKKIGGNSNLRFNVRDIFNSIEWSGGTDLPNQDFVTSGTFDFSNRTFSLSYTTSFGNDKLKSTRARSVGSEEERKRVGN